MAFQKDFLRDRRLYCGLSQLELAKPVGVCKQAVQKWESGDSVPRPKRLQKIAEVLNAKIAEFSDIHVSGNGNCVASHNNFLSPPSAGMILESFRAGLIGRLINSELSPDALKIALKIVNNY